MTTPIRVVSTVTCAVVLLLGVTGCRDEGPAERAGKKIDQAVDDTREKVEDAVEDEGPLEKAGRKLDDAAEDVKEGATGDDS